MPAVNCPKLAEGPIVSASVAGTVPPAEPPRTAKNVLGVIVGLPTACSHCAKKSSSRVCSTLPKPDRSVAICLLSAMNAASSALP
jgi:hypothetical protein